MRLFISLLMVISRMMGSKGSANKVLAYLKLKFDSNGKAGFI
jgi:hypothetical protein